MAEFSPKRLASDLILAPATQIPSWIEPMILPKSGIMIFGGETKIGKSLFMLELIRAATLRDNPYKCPLLTVPEDVRILLLEQELGEYVLRDRCQKIWRRDLEADNTKVVSILDTNAYFLSKSISLDLSSIEGRDNLQGMVEKVNPNILFLDPIGKMHLYDENDSTQINRLFNFLQKLLIIYKKNEMSIVLSHHFLKRFQNRENQGDPLDLNNFRGSGRWTHDPDTIMTIARTEEHRDGHRWWECRVRWTLRCGENPDDMTFRLNREDRLEVRWVEPRRLGR